MAQTRVGDLTIDEFKDLVRETVAETLAEMLSDPDEGLELREDFRAALERSIASVEAGDKTVPADEVATKLGLSW